MQREKSSASASISAVVVFLSALLALGLLASLYPSVTSLFSAARAGLKEGGERASELIRIYIHSVNETELDPPVITIINGYDRESILTDYVVVARDGRILASGKMGGSLQGVRLPPGGILELRPEDFGLSFATFAAMADQVKAIYIRTAEGNSFGSSYGPPPKITPDIKADVRERSRIILVFGTTSTLWNISLTGNFTLPTTGEAMIVKNVILVDSNGVVRGGVTAGNKWSDGSFDPNAIPDEVAALTTLVDKVPINAYYVVPPQPRFYYGSTPCFGIYSGSDTCPAYIEMLEFHPVEYYIPGGPAAALAYWMRYPGPYEVYVTNIAGYWYTMSRALQMPAPIQYPGQVVGPQVRTVSVIYGGTLYQVITNNMQLSNSGNLLVLGPIIDYVLEGIGGCRGGGYGTVSCSGSFTLPADPNYRIVQMSYRLYVTSQERPPSWSFIVDNYYSATIDGPWGRYTGGASGVISGSWATGTTVSFQGTVDCGLRDIQRDYRVQASCSIAMEVKLTLLRIQASSPSATRTANALPTFLTLSTLTRTATATFLGGWLTTQTNTITITTTWLSTCRYDVTKGSWVCYYNTATYTMTQTVTRTLTGQPISLRDQIRQAVVNETRSLSGDMAIHYGGTVQGGAVIKVRAPIVVLNYVYVIRGTPRPPPLPSGPSGGGGDYSVRMVCKVEGYTRIDEGPAGGAGGGDVNPVQPVSGAPGPGNIDLGYTYRNVQRLYNVICKPI